MAAAPAHRPGPRTAPRRRHRPGRGSARGAVCPRRAARARAVAYYRRAADVAAGMFAHADAIRLHKEALSIVRNLPEGRDRDRQELAVLEAMAAPLNARYGYSSPELQEALERSIALADSLGSKDSTLLGMVALWASRFVQGRTADGYQDGQPQPGPGRTRLRAERPGALRRRRVGRQPRDARAGPYSILRSPTQLASGAYLAEHRYPARRARHGLGSARPLAAGPRRGRPGQLPARDHAGPVDRPPVQPGRGPGLRLHHPPDARRHLRAEGQRRASCASCATGTASPTTASGC